MSRAIQTNNYISSRYGWPSNYNRYSQTNSKGNLGFHFLVEKCRGQVHPGITRWRHPLSKAIDGVKRVKRSWIHSQGQEPHGERRSGAAGGAGRSGSGHQDIWGFHTPRFSDSPQTPTVRLTILLRSDTSCPGERQAPRGRGSVTQQCPHFRCQSTARPAL